MPASRSAAKSTAVEPFVAHCLELLSAIGSARSRAMFGGHGLYVDDLFIALIAEDRLYLKVDGDTVERFRAAGCEQWIYRGGDKPMPMGYWSAPDEAMDAPALMAAWARLARQAALAAKAAKGVRPAAKAAKAARPAAKAAKAKPPATPVRRTAARASAPKKRPASGAAKPKRATARAR
jgi:DNA transformation protein